MSTINGTFNHFKRHYPATLAECCLGKDFKPMVGGIGIAILAGRLFQISSIIGGSAAVSAQILTFIANIQLKKSYTATGGNNNCVENALTYSSFVIPVFPGGMVASLIGHPISLVGRVALHGIFLASAVAVHKMVNPK